MPPTVTSTSLPGVLVVEPRVFTDDRGHFFESHNVRDFDAAIGRSITFVQDNQSRSHRGVLRGMHYQIDHAQAKLVRVLAGEIFDVVVDLRRSEPTFGRWVGMTLSSENRRQLWVPEGFAHGFIVVSDTADVAYKATDYWYAAHERSVVWNDADIGITWPAGIEPVLSGKDKGGLRLQEAEVFG